MSRLLIYVWLAGDHQISGTSKLECCGLTFIYRGFGDVPDTSSLDDVSNYKLLDGLVLRDTSGAVGASDWLDMASALLGSSIVSPFRGLFDYDWVVEADLSQFELGLFDKLWSNQDAKESKQFDTYHCVDRFSLEL